MVVARHIEAKRAVRRAPVIAAMLVGLGLAAAPVAFQMFTRAPKGGEMITDFAPYMTSQRAEAFRGYLDQIDRAEAESRARLQPFIVGSGEVDDAGYRARFPSVATLNDTWATTIRPDMADLVDTIDRNLENYAAVAALPPFPLFPWFFVLPGLMIAGVGVAALRSGANSRRLLLVLACLGVAVVLAPAVFQMFTRAPKGADMIDDFRPMMVRQRVQNVQGYFITIGAAEGQLRNLTVPLAAEIAGPIAPASSAYPSVFELSESWPTIVGDFAPMIGAMADNLDNFEAVDAMPKFSLFPWFFVGPGLLVAGLALLARASSSPVHNTVKQGIQP